MKINSKNGLDFWKNHIKCADDDNKWWQQIDENLQRKFSCIQTNSDLTCGQQECLIFVHAYRCFWRTKIYLLSTFWSFIFIYLLCMRSLFCWMTKKNILQSFCFFTSLFIKLLWVKVENNNRKQVNCLMFVSMFFSHVFLTCFSHVFLKN